MRSVRKIISGLIYLACFGMALITVFILLNKYSLYVVESGSMEPDYPVGSLLIVKPCEAENLQAGDVITYERNGMAVTHRVVSINTDEKTLITKGDANNSADIHPVDFANVAGIVIKCIPNLGWLAMYMSGIYGKVGIIALCAIGMIIDPGSAKEKKNENKV